MAKGNDIAEVIVGLFVLLWMALSVIVPVAVVGCLIYLVYVLGQYLLS